jgi:hypothetical protein
MKREFRLFDHRKNSFFLANLLIFYRKTENLILIVEFVKPNQ